MGIDSAEFPHKKKKNLLSTYASDEMLRFSIKKRKKKQTNQTTTTTKTTKQTNKQTQNLANAWKACSGFLSCIFLGANCVRIGVVLHLTAFRTRQFV